VVYAKRPFAGPEQVLDYVGRYTHRVAIANNRLLSVEGGKVRFRWKDYRDGDRWKTMSLDGEEFVRRFLVHVLPDGFRRIRYFGFLANPHRAATLALCRRLLGAPNQLATKAVIGSRDRLCPLEARDFRACMHCAVGFMTIVAVIAGLQGRATAPDTS
jgi:hypothetical protein